MAAVAESFGVPSRLLSLTWSVSFPAKSATGTLASLRHEARRVACAELSGCAAT